MDPLFGRDEWRRWRPIGQDVLRDLSTLMVESTPFAGIAASIMHLTLGGDLGYRPGDGPGRGASVTFTPDERDRLKGRLQRLWRYWVMCGMVPVRAVPDDAPFFYTVLDASSGYFVARIDEKGRSEVGWHMHDAPAGPLDPRFFLGSDHQPDPSVKVYVWPGREPDVRLDVPFLSILAPLLEIERNRRELTRNHMAADALACRPALLLSAAEQRPVAAGGARESADLSNSVSAIVSGMTRQGEWEATRLAEQVQLDEERRREYRGRDRPTQEVDGYGPSGKRRMVTRDSVVDRLVTLPSGTRMQATPAPTMVTDWVKREQHFYDMFHYVMGWPSQTRSGRHTSSGHGGVSAEDMERMRMTVSAAREAMTQAFSFVYANFMGPAQLRAHEARWKPSMEQLDSKITTLRQYFAVLEARGKEAADSVLDGTEAYIERRLEDERSLEEARRQTLLDEQTEAVLEEGREEAIPLIAEEVRANIEDELPPPETDEEVLIKRLEREAVVMRSDKLREVLAVRQQQQVAISEARERLRTATLVFMQPVPFNTALLLELGRDGVLNSEEVVRMTLEHAGLPVDVRERLMAGVEPSQKKWGAPAGEDLAPSDTTPTPSTLETPSRT